MQVSTQNLKVFKHHESASISSFMKNKQKTFSNKGMVVTHNNCFSPCNFSECPWFVIT